MAHGAAAPAGSASADAMRDAGDGGASAAGWAGATTEDEEVNFDLFSCDAPQACDEVDIAGDEDETQWEVVEWAPGDPVMPSVIIHRQLAQCWASARMLSEWLLGHGRPAVQGASLVVELGASLGLPSLAASLAGAARCVATDLYPSGAAALEATIARNRRALGRADLFGGVASRRLSWFEAPEALGDLHGAADVVLCADVIYESRAAPAIAFVADAALRTGGVLVFASRYGRVGLREFLASAAERGLALRCEQQLRSEHLGLALTLEDAHGLWVFDKPSPAQTS